MVRLTCLLLLLFASTAVQAQEEQPSANEIRVFKLQHVQSGEIGPTLSQLFEDVVMTADERTNSLLVRGRPEELKEVEELLKTLDEDAPAARTPYGSLVRQYGAAPAGLTKGPLQSKYQQLEGEIAKMAKMCRKLDNDPDAVSDNRRGDLVEKLGQLVTEAFELRQQMRREDVKRLRERLEKVETTVDDREDAKEQIVEHRVASLLDADQDLAALAPNAGQLYQQLARLPGAAGIRYTPSTQIKVPPGQSGPIGLRGPTRYAPSLPALNSQAPMATIGKGANPLKSSEYVEFLQAAEMCRQAAKEADLLRVESRVAAYRVLERRFVAYTELAKLELQAAESKLDTSKQRFERLKSLFESGITTSGEYDKARGELKIGEIDVKRARIATDFYQRALDEAQGTVAKALDTVKEKAEQPQPDANRDTIR